MRLRTFVVGGERSSGKTGQTYFPRPGKAGLTCFPSFTSPPISKIKDREVAEAETFPATHANIIAKIAALADGDFYMVLRNMNSVRMCRR